MKRLKLEKSLGSHLARQASKCGVGVITLLRKLLLHIYSYNGGASLLAFADVTYVGHKYEDAAQQEEGK